MALGLIAFAAIALTVVAISGFTLRPGETVVPTSKPASTIERYDTATPTPTPTVTSTASVVVSLLSDPKAATAESWWALSVSSGRVPNAISGPIITGSTASTEGLVTVETLQQALESNAQLSGVVIAQAGSAEVAGASPVADIVSSVQALWQGIIDRGAWPVAALLPPSDANSQRVIEINSAIAAAAAESGVPVLDLHTSVVSAEGGWALGLSDDGETPNEGGVDALAQAAITQLPELLAAASAATPPPA